jgi:hypothetical protein
VTVEWYDYDGNQQTATVAAADDYELYLAARHTARANNRLHGVKQETRPERAARLDPVKADEARPWIGEAIKGKRWEIFADPAAHRIRITFFVKLPSARVREAVKAAGFKWSPNGQCWLARMTNANWGAAQKLTMVFDGGITR